MNFLKSNDLYPSISVRNLGLIQTLNFPNMFQAFAVHVFYHIQDFSRIQRHLDTTTTIVLAC